MTTWQYAEARRLWAEGVSARAIGEAIGASTSAVASAARAHREDFPERPRGTAEGGREELVRRAVETARAAGVAAAAERHGVSRRTVSRWLARARADGGGR